MIEPQSESGVGPELLSAAGQVLFDPTREVFEWDGNKFGVQTASTIAGLPSQVRIFDEVVAQETGVAVEWQFHLSPTTPDEEGSDVTHVYYLDGRSSIIVRHDTPDDSLVSSVNVQEADVVQELKPVDADSLARLIHILSAHHSHSSV